MENQKIINLLNKSDTNSKHFATKKWYIINDENNSNCGVNKDTGAGAPDTIKYDTRVLKPYLCDYAEVYIFWLMVLLEQPQLMQILDSF